MSRIPMNMPFLDSAEYDAIRDALESGEIHGRGPATKRVEAQLCKWLEVGHALLTTSCTHALEMAMSVLEIGPGDEVIMPSFTFVSAANAVALRGAEVVFAEIDPGTLNVDPEDVARRVTSRTRAIVPVHYAGVGCDMDRLGELSREHGIAVVEDAAQAVDSKYRGRFLGTLGDVGCYSFHGTKNITCGEGGAFLTSNRELGERAEIIAEKGTNRSAFFRGQVDKYTWVTSGSSYVPSDILAAMLEAQLAKRDKIREGRQVVWQAYYNALMPLVEEYGLILPVVPEGCEQNYHAFFFRVASENVRDLLLEALHAEGIGATFHFVPLHSSPFARGELKNRQELPITDHCSATLIRLPIYPQLHDRMDTLAPGVATVVRQNVNAKT